jgi:hypothetical protein
MTPNGGAQFLDFPDHNFGMDDSMTDFGHFSYGAVNGNGKENVQDGTAGYFSVSESDAALMEPHLQWITT